LGYDEYFFVFFYWWEKKKGKGIEKIAKGLKFELSLIIIATISLNVALY